MVDWLRTISSPSTTTADVFAGDVLNWVIQYHDDTDLAAGDPNGIVQILTETVFSSGKLKFYDSDRSSKVTFNVPDYAENKTVSFPATLPATDDIMTTTSVQTVTGKNLNSNNNAFSNIGDSAIATHTSTKISITAKGQLNSAIVYTDQNNTFGSAVNQIFPSTRLQINDSDDSHQYIIAGSNLAANRTITLPLLAGNDTAVMQAFAQPLSNKTMTSTTIEADLNSLSGIAQNPVVKVWGSYQPVGSAASLTGVGNLEGILRAWTPQGGGTPSNTWDTTEGLIINLVTTTTANNMAGVSPSTTIGQFRRARAVKAVIRWKASSTTNSRLYFGFSSATTLPLTDTPLGTSDHGVIVGFNTTDVNFTARGNDGSGAATATSLGVAKNANFNTMEINWLASGNANVILNGATTTISAAGDLPATTTNLFCHLQIQNSTTTAMTVSIKGFWIEST